MALKNYSTEIPANKSITAVQIMLQKAGASGIMLNYEKGTGRIESLIFKIEFDGRDMAFKLPIKWRQAKDKLIKDGISKARSDDEYCYRVSWRIVHNWLEQQLALLSLEMVDLIEIFLPYSMQKGGSTLYEKIQENPLLLGN